MKTALNFIGVRAYTESKRPSHLHGLMRLSLQPSVKAWLNYSLKMHNIPQV